MALSRKQILHDRNRKLPTEVVKVPEWADADSGEDSVIVKTLNGLEKGKYQQSLMQQGKRGDVKIDMTTAQVRLVAMSVVDETGAQLFTEDDVAALNELSGKALDRVSDVAGKLCGLTKDDLEELVKNSEPTPTNSSSSV